MRDIYYKCEPHKLEINHVPNNDDRHLFNAWLVLKQDLATRSSPVSDLRYKYAFDCDALSEHIL